MLAHANQVSKLTECEDASAWVRVNDNRKGITGRDENQVQRSDPRRRAVFRDQVTSVIESSERRATLLATEEINQAGGINGRELELVWHDPESRPAHYQALAERLSLEDGVHIILGCYISSTPKEWFRSSRSSKRGYYPRTQRSGLVLP